MYMINIVYLYQLHNNYIYGTDPDYHRLIAALITINQLNL